VSGQSGAGIKDEHRKDASRDGRHRTEQVGIRAHVSSSTNANDGRRRTRLKRSCRDRSALLYLTILAKRAAGLHPVLQHHAALRIELSKELQPSSCCRQRAGASRNFWCGTHLVINETSVTL
jgi:hypothetical protein